jgi:Sulfotransferase domain
MIGTRTLPPAVQRFGQDAVVTFGRLTAPARMSPTFLICGAQRCGTTSMYRTLSQHAGVLKAVLHKGVHYFDNHYERGMAWYRGHFPLELTAHKVERAVGYRPHTFESSPYYMFHPLAAGRIAADLPGVKLVVLLRDPVERAYSAHAHEYARGYETEPFERALELEESRLAGEAERIVADPAYQSHSHQHHGYLERGRYVDHLRRLEAIVGRDRLHVVDSADFFTRPEKPYAETLDFLGLPDAPGTVFERHNARPRSPLPDSLRKRLEEHFRPYDEDLARWWSRTPAWRR